MVRSRRQAAGSARALLPVCAPLLALVTGASPCAQGPHGPGPSPPGSPRDELAPLSSFRRGLFTSVQVDVDARGANVRGDTANEPSLAVDPRDESRMAIGWRHFEPGSPELRLAGRGYSRNGGKSWTFPGVLEPDRFRTDPVLESDAEGVFYYYSLALAGPFGCDLFRSLDGGASWSAPVRAFGGDKPWMAIDRTRGLGHGHVYCYWNCCSTQNFTRSVDGGLSFAPPVVVPDHPQSGTLAIGTEGEVYLAGFDAVDPGSILVVRSTDAMDPRRVPTFERLARVDLGGEFKIGGEPNPQGLLGQVWIAVEHSLRRSRGWVYLACSLDPPGPDPLDVFFARSTDGGRTWSAAVRVNADPPGPGRWQWFGTLGCAVDGRLDLVWNDTSASGQANLSELYYSVSHDGGVKWTPGIPVSPPWDSHVGWPGQQKIGDYYDIHSGASAAHVAYAATFNGEQDVYYLRLGE